MEFYLELKKEEAEMTEDQVDHVGIQKSLRAKKLMELGDSARALTQSEGRKRRRLKMRMPSIKSISRRVSREDVADTETTTVERMGRRSQSLTDLGTRSLSSMRLNEVNAQWTEVHAPQEGRESSTSSSSNDPITF